MEQKKKMQKDERFAWSETEKTSSLEDILSSKSTQKGSNINQQSIWQTLIFHQYDGMIHCQHPPPPLPSSSSSLPPFLSLSLSLSLSETLVTFSH
ncbi:uncharacterized protein J3R85_013064 [Psidium guajava]|nr:uncharacterized protein J3R85_013064 [Psidium guajava]